MINKNRRSLLMLGGGLVGSSLLGCSDTPTQQQYNQSDIDGLTRQQALESENSGQSRYGMHRYRGYSGLEKLQWFGLDPQQNLILEDDSLPAAIDMHCHLGMSILFEPKLDLNQLTPRTQHLLDCDGTEPPCELDLDVYINANFSSDQLKGLRSTIATQGLWGNDFARSQTIPNLIREMDSMRVSKAAILPIKLGLPFGDNLTENWRKAIEQSPSSDRFIKGCSVHHEDGDKLQQLEMFAQQGLRILKLHPTVQKFYPNDDSLMEVYELAQQLGMIIFFHGGRAGIEPESSHRYAMPRHYERALANFPNLPFILGHGGARDGEAMLQLALKYENAWLGTHGQGITHLDKMIAATEGRRLLFGTDWPFYHIGASLAKVLITTDSPSRAALREAVLRGNAEQLLAS